MSKEQQRGRATLEHVSKLAQEVLMRDGFHTPTLIVLGDQASTVAQMTGHADTFKKRAAMLRLIGKSMAEQGGLGELQRVFLVNEAWASQPNEAGEMEHRPSEDPNRIEILIVAMVDIPKIETHILMYEMIRNEDGQLHDLLAYDPAEGEGETRAYLLEEFIAGYQNEMERSK